MINNNSVEIIFTVSELNREIKGLLDAQTWLTSVCVKGELTGYRVYPSGHHYFSVKDAEGTLKCVMFRNAAQNMKLKPENGMQVLVYGRVGVYERDGVYQLYATRIIPDGAGDIYAAFEQLKAKLYREGLFDPERKKPLPRFPQRIAVVTSSAGAAIRDILRILSQRYPLAEVRILPVRVQGAEAPGEIADAIDYANYINAGDLIITGRGGGSAEELWAFNDERVAYAIARSRIPVISAVGHEPDVTIADFVADVRAATPSNAAEIAVPDRVELQKGLENSGNRLASAMRRVTEQRRERVLRLAGSRALSSPTAYIDDRRMALDNLTNRLGYAAKGLVNARGTSFARLAAGLDAMSPLKVLKRGYAIAEKDGKAVRSVSDVAAGDTLSVKLSDGEIRAKVIA